MNTGLSISKYISDYTFNEIMEQYRSYLLKISSNSYRQSVIYEQDDLMQELNLVLWKLWKSCQEAVKCKNTECRDKNCNDLNEYQFRAKLIVSLNHRLADLFRRKFVKHEISGPSKESNFQLSVHHVPYDILIKELVDGSEQSISEIIKACIDPDIEVKIGEMKRARKLVSEVL